MFVLFGIMYSNLQHNAESSCWLLEHFLKSKVSFNSILETLCKYESSPQE